MTSLTDVALIENFQKNRDSKSYNELFNRYKFFALKKTKEFNNRCKEDYSLSFEDHLQEVKISLLKVLNNIDISKIKNKENYKLAISFNYSMNNYMSYLKNNIEKMNEMRAYNVEHLNWSERSHLEFLSHKFRHLSYNNFSYSSSSTNYVEALQEFQETLKGIEYKIFNHFMQGEKKKDIAKSLKVTPPNISYHMRKIKKKFNFFIKDFNF